jgi:3-phenylpropionate/cinnamic acid dioxygenase small subunit
LVQHNKVPALEIKFPALLRRESRRRRLERRGEREEGEVCSATREDAYRQAHHFGLVQNTGTYLL